jgi:tetratricopeptide (TPR) repeat protein
VALFAVHPLRVESVAWVTERRDVLSGLFFFLTLGCWMRYVDAPDGSRERRRAWIWSLVWFVLAGMSKVAVFPLPLVLVVLDLWPLKRATLVGWGRIVKEKLAHAGVMVALMLVAALGQGSANSMYSLEAHPLPPRLVHMGFTFFFYPVKTLLPRSLIPMYEMPPDAAFFTPPYLYPAIIGATVLLVMLFLWRPAVSLAVTWAVFFLFILPTSGLTQAGSQIAADRYSYLSCLSFAFLAGGSLFLLARNRVGVWIGAGIGSLLVATCAVLTHAQCNIWKDTRTFWEYVHAVQPENTFALDSLGHLKVQDAKAELDPEKKKQLILEAVAYHDRAFQLKGDARHLLNVAEAIHEMAFADDAKFDEHVKVAFETCERGFKLADEQGVRYQLPWYRTRGSLYMDMGRYADAAHDLELYTADNPLDIEAHLFLGMTYVELKKPKEAEATLAYVVKQEPGDVRAWASLGQLYMTSGLFGPAKTALQRVLELQAASNVDPATDAVAATAREWLKAIQQREAQRGGAVPNTTPVPPVKPGG